MKILAVDTFDDRPPPDCVEDGGTHRSRSPLTSCPNDSCSVAFIQERLVLQFYSQFRQRTVRHNTLELGIEEVGERSTANST